MINIDKEFKNLIPPLTDNERKQLEENILHDGIQDPLKIWQGTLVDGHNRYEIAQAHNLEFAIVEMEFASRDEVKIWILKNQLGRRNLIAPVRIKLALLAESFIAQQAKARQAEYHGNQYDSGLQDKCPEVQIKANATINRDQTEAQKDFKPKRNSQAERQNTTNNQLAQMAGVSDKTVQRYKKIQADGSDEVKSQVDKGEISINEGYNKTVQAKRKEDIQRQVEEIEQQAIEKPDGLFDVIVIDPPWGYIKEAHHGSYDANGRRGTCPYPEMSQEELKAIELPAASDCVLFLWTTHKFIWDAKELLDHWNFNYRCLLVWDKQQLGLGNLIRMQCEFCLVGLKGNPKFKDAHNIRDLIEEPRREHSRKPDKFYQLVDELCAGRKLDYFSRQQREGWSSYGNDTKKFSVA